MRVVTHCMTCHNERQKTGESLAAPIYAELNEDGVAVGQCARGHRIATVVQQPRYETLFDWACLALLDGYSREAVASFSAALERFYEIALRALCFHNGMSHEAIEATWKNVEGQSERQYGAFLFLYATHTKTGAPKWDDKLTRFRNKVVHKGHLASREKAQWYGEACYERIHAIGAQLRESCTLAWNQEYFRQSRERAEKHASTITAHVSRSPVYTIMDTPHAPFADAMGHFLRNNWWRPAGEPGS